MYKILENNLHSFGKNNSFNDSKYLVQIDSQAKTSGTKLPEIHGVEKNLNPNLRPEKQPAIPKLKTRKATCHSQTRKI